MTEIRVSFRLQQKMKANLLKLLLTSTFLFHLVHLSTANTPKRNLLPIGTITEASPNDTLCCSQGNCSQSGASCAVDDDDETYWMLKSGTEQATLTILLNSSSVLSDISLSFTASSVIPSSITMTAFSQTVTTNSITWRTYFYDVNTSVPQNCQPSDTYLRKRGSEYYICLTISRLCNVSVPDGLFSIRNGSDDGWLWWKVFQVLQVSFEAKGTVYTGSNNSIEVADIRLFGWDEPTDGCNCHPAGVDINETCQQSRCICRYPSEGNEQCTPNVDFILPSYGPTSGGTISYATGNYLSNAVYVTLAFDDVNLLLHKNDSTIAFKTSQGKSQDLNTPIPMQVYGENLTDIRWLIIADTEFTFKSDPIIDRIYPLKSIAKGGIPQTIVGSNLDSVAYPFITIVIKIPGIPPKYIDFRNPSALEEGDEFCDHINSTTLVCISPNTEEVASYPVFETFIIVYVDINRYRNISNCEITNKNCSFQITQNPTVNSWDEEQMYLFYEGRKIFEIEGSRFHRSASFEDYIITVGGVVVPIESLLDNNIVFYPPDASNFTSLDDAKQTLLTVGYLVYTVGYIKYYLNWIDVPANQIGLIAGLVCGVGGVIIIVLLVLLYRTYRKKKTPVPPVTFRPRPIEIEEQRYTSQPWREPSLLDTLPQNLKEKVESCLVPYHMIQIEMESTLGSGNFGTVYRGTFIGADSQQEPVAIKTLRSGQPLEIQDKLSFLEEATIMAEFHHRNVLSLIAVVIEQDLPYVVLPLMENGALRDFVSNHDNLFTVCDLVSYALQVADGMEYLASNKFVHRDLAARNCMINKEMVVKVADFGLARDIFEKDYYRPQDLTRPLPVKWMAIECLSNNTKFTESSDVWSFGVLLWELMSRGKRPYAGVDNIDLNRFLRLGRRLECPQDTPYFIYDLMLSCWRESPGERPKFKNIVDQLNDILSYATVPSAYGKRISSILQEPEVDYNEIELQVSKTNSYLELMRLSVLPSD